MTRNRSMSYFGVRICTRLISVEYLRYFPKKKDRIDSLAAPLRLNPLVDGEIDQVLHLESVITIQCLCLYLGP